MRISGAVVAAEVLKVRKRWLPYVLLLPVIALILLQTAAGYFAGWRHDRDLDLLRVSVFPSSLPSLLDLMQYLCSIALSIVVASAVATEFNWGTVRQAIARGQTRSQYLLAKLAGLSVMCGAAFLVVLGVTASFSAILAGIEDASPPGPSVGEGFLMVIRGAYAIVPYLLLSFCLAVVGRSTTLGVGGVLFFIIGESIALGILGAYNATDGTRVFFLGHNVVALLAANRLGGEEISLAPRAAPGASDLPDPWAAAFVIAIYCAVFLLIAFSVFQKRDMTAGAGAS